MPRSLLTTTIRDEVETAPRQCMKKLQLEWLRAGVGRVAADVPFRRVSFDEAGIDARNIQSFEDLARLPFPIKRDLRNHAHQASRAVRARIEDNLSDVLRPGESAVVFVCGNAPGEPRI